MIPKINPAGERTCKDHSLIVRRIAGWQLATLFNKYFGATMCVLVGAGQSGEDLEFAATDQWISYNHVTNLGINQKDGEEALKHVRSCSAKECVEAARRLKMIIPLLKSVKLPGDDEVSKDAAIMSTFASRHYGGEPILFTRGKNGSGDYIDAAKPFFEWFAGEYRDDWQWPIEV